MSCARAQSTSRRSIAWVLAPKVAFEKLNRPRFQAVKPAAASRRSAKSAAPCWVRSAASPVAARMAPATSPKASTPSSAKELRARKAAAKAACERSSNRSCSRASAP